MKRIFGIVLCTAGSAWAGGFDLPDNGTEALGRGGAFVAKADDGTALEYNIAGLAGQQGTRLTVDTKLVFQDLAFTRSGSYPGDPSDSRTPYAGQPYPTVHDGESIFFAPMLGLSTDLGRHLGPFRLGFGLYGPPSIGKHNYGVAVDDGPAEVKLPNGMKAPAPSRYDIASTNLLIVFPTFALAYRPHRIIDFGFAWQIVYANFDLYNANFTPLGPNNCPTPDYAGCDAYGHVKTSGSSFSSSDAKFDNTGYEFKPGLSSFGWIFSAMLHPTRWLDFGVNYRPQINVRTQGTLHAIPPAGFPKQMDSPVTFTATLPHQLRVGGRAVKRYADGSEQGDLEIDFLYENWAAEKADHLHAEDFLLGAGGMLDVDVMHNYQDTFGVRIGGGYNRPLTQDWRLTGRLGTFFDAAATRSAHTRLDFDTLAKWGFTTGLGIAWRGLQLNAAYALVFSPDRTVSDSELRAISAINGTNYSMNDPKIFVGDGLYHASVQLLSLGLTVNFGNLKY